MPARDLPAKLQLPVSGLSKPVNRLKRVVLPAPLGPIRAVIAPRGISRCSTSTAVRPPKCLETPSMVTIGSTLATPGRIAPMCSPVVFAAGLLGMFALLDKGELLFISKDSLGTVDNKQHQSYPNKNKPHRCRLNACHEWQVSVSR